jgi:hypothetical protein
MRSAAILLAALSLGLGPSSLNPCAAASSGPVGFACCKMCKAGKACGDSCIARDKVCHKGKGCACNG